MLRAKGFLKYWQGLFGSLSEQAGVSKVYILGLLPSPRLGILGEYIKDVFAVCHDLPPKSYVVGLLGSTVLRHFRITIDYGEGDLETCAGTVNSLGLRN